MCWVVGVGTRMWLPPTHYNRVDHDPWSANTPTGVGEIGGMLLGVWDDIVYSQSRHSQRRYTTLGLGVVWCGCCVV